MDINRRSSASLLCQCIGLSLVLSLAGCSDRKGTEKSSGTDQQNSLSEGLKYGNLNTSPFVMQTKVLATISDDERPAAIAKGYEGHGDAPEANAQAPMYHIMFNEQGNGVAYKAGKSGKTVAVFNGKGGALWKDIGAMVISPDGRRFAYTAMDDKNIWHLVTDSKEDVEFHHLGEPVFSPDSRHIACQASANEDWYIAVDNIQSKGGKFSYDQPLFSADSAKIAYVENLDENMRKLYIVDLRLKSLRILDSVVSPVVSSPDGKQIAVVIRKNDKQRVVRISFDKPDIVNEGSEYNSISNLIFSPDGKSIAYYIERGGAQYLVLNTSEERLEFTPAKLPVVNPVLPEVATAVITPNGMRLYQGFKPGAVKEKSYDDITGIIYSKDGIQHAYAATKGKAGFIVINGKEGSHFDKAVEPVFSPDGKRIVYRARKDGKRFVVVADSDGKTLRQHRAYEQVFQPVFTPDGKSVAYGVQDGKKLVWVVEKL